MAVHCVQGWPGGQTNISVWSVLHAGAHSIRHPVLLLRMSARATRNGAPRVGAVVSAAGHNNRRIKTNGQPKER